MGDDRPQKSDRSSVGALIGLLAFFFIVMLMCAGALVSLVGGEMPVENGIGVIEIRGTIATADPVVKNIQSFQDDENIKAVLVRIDSPGGSVSASQEMVEAIRSIKKPVVISMGDMAASGGFYVACAGPKIFANPGTLTGSIGVISQIMEAKDLMEFLKIGVHTVKTGALKDSGSPYREFEEADRAYFASLGREILDQFVSHVAKARSKTPEEIMKLADGAVWSGRRAHELGLVDELGGMHAAVAELRTMAGIKGKHTLIYPKRPADSIIEDLLAEGASHVTEGIRTGVQTIVSGQMPFEYRYIVE